VSLCTARRKSESRQRMESSVRGGEFALFMIDGISVQPSTMAQQV
jgi:hypothetical protein